MNTKPAVPAPPPVAPAFASHMRLAVTTIVFLAPLVVITRLCTIKLRGYRHGALQLTEYWRLIREDGPIESLTSAAFAAASLLAGSVAVRFWRERRRLHAMGLVLVAVGLLLIAGEEISWGQRILGFKSPEYFTTHNLQKETNLHNLLPGRTVHLAYVVAGLYGTLAWLGARALRTVCPKAADLGPLLAPPWFLSLYFLPVALIYLYYDWWSPTLVQWFGPEYGWERNKHFMIGRDQEPAEWLMALGCMLFLVTIRWPGLWRSTPTPSKDGAGPRHLAPPHAEGGAPLQPVE